MIYIQIFLRFKGYRVKSVLWFMWENLTLDTDYMPWYIVYWEGFHLWQKELGAWTPPPPPSPSPPGGNPVSDNQ